MYPTEESRSPKSVGRSGHDTPVDVGKLKCIATYPPVIYFACKSYDLCRQDIRIDINLRCEQNLNSLFK